MRIRSLVAAVSVMFSATGALPASATTPPASPTVAIESLEQTWADALLAQDTDQLARLLDARFQLTMASNESAADLDAYLALSKSRAYTAMSPTIVSIDVNGGVAVAVVEMKVGWPSGAPSPSSWRFTDTWVLSGDQWRAVSRVAQPVANDR